jgi:hypothetical protein
MRQGCQIELVLIRFLIEKVQKPFDLIQYSKTIRFGTKTASADMKKKNWRFGS